MPSVSSSSASEPVQPASLGLMSARALLRVVVLTVLAMLAAGCGSSEHNKTDETFVQQMVPHHQQAVEMARMVGSHDAGPGVRALAGRIEKAQGPEIEKMDGWLDDWDVKKGHGAGGHMPGMMDDGDMRALDELTGSRFDQFFLSLMIQHHHGAIDMAKEELADGANDDAKDLARDIRRSQTAEIDEMNGLLVGP